MLDYTAFSTLRLSTIFPPAMVEDYPFYVEVGPNRGFDTEYLGGQWHEVLIDGVQFFYPAAAGRELGVAELWAAGCVMAAAVRDKPESRSADLVPTWAANANQVLKVLELPIHMGSDEAAVRALATGTVRSVQCPGEWHQTTEGVKEGSVRLLNFALRAPDLYHVDAIVHNECGLLKLDIRRPDSVRKNDPAGGYDACFGWLYEEASEE